MFWCVCSSSNNVKPKFITWLFDKGIYKFLAVIRVQNVWGAFNVEKELRDIMDRRSWLVGKEVLTQKDWQLQFDHKWPKIDKFRYNLYNIKLKIDKFSCAVEKSWHFSVLFLFPVKRGYLFEKPGKLHLKFANWIDMELFVFFIVALSERVDRDHLLWNDKIY